MSLPLSRHSGRSGPLSAFCLPRGLAARSRSLSLCVWARARRVRPWPQHESPPGWSKVDYYSPGYHPCSALGFILRRSRGREIIRGVVDYCSLLARGESGREKRHAERWRHLDTRTWFRLTRVRRTQFTARSEKAFGPLFSRRPLRQLKVLRERRGGRAGQRRARDAPAAVRPWRRTAAASRL